MKCSEFLIPGMCCPTEQQIVRNRLKSIRQIQELDFNTLEREVTVRHELEDDGQILAALQSLGLGARRKLEPGAIAVDQAPDQPNSYTAKLAKYTLALSGLAALLAEGIAYATQHENSWPVIGLALISMTAGGRDTLRKAIASVRTLTLNINFLMALAVLGAACIGQWPEAAMVTFLFGVAEMVEAFSMERARHAIRGLVELTPETATVEVFGGMWSPVPVTTVKVGQKVRVKPGERIPLDGTVTAGASTVNQAPITGESIPVSKDVGDPVFAGTINERGAFVFMVTANAGNTTLARIIRAVQEAQAERAPIQRFIDDFARYYTPAVVLLALLIATVPPFLGASFSVWFYKALVLLVIACPCALVISTPVTVVSALAAAARAGILVKGGAYMEAGRKLKAIALDKTGTLTYGKPQITDVLPLVDRPAEELLHIAASLEALSEHPIASAVIAAAQNHNDLLPVEGFQSLTGKGVQGTVSGIEYFLGNQRLVREIGSGTPESAQAAERLEAEGKTVLILATRQQPLAVLAVADTVREASIEALRQLHALGIRCVMLTGDNPATARAIAGKVGIDDARGDLLPEDKLAAIQDLQKQFGPVGMVGDGINDAPALAKSDIGFAMGAAGTDTAIETADVALMEDDLRKLPSFIKLSRKTGTVLAQNIAFSIALKAVFFALALSGHATLWMAVFADMGGSLAVVFNGLRLLRVTERHEA